MKVRGAGTLRWMVEDGKSPYIGENGNWWEWSDDQERYVDTGKKATGTDGKSGPVPYPAGSWDKLTTYNRTSKAAPYVELFNDYYLLDKDGPSTNEPPNTSDSWVKFDKFNQVYTEILLADFGKLASAVFSGDHMISQFGEDKLGNQTSDYKDFGKVDENENPLFTPNIDIDFFKGLLKALDVEIRGSFESNSSGNRIKIDPSSRRMIFTTHDDFDSGYIGFDAQGAILDLFKRFSASTVYSSSARLDGYSFLLKKYGQTGNETDRVTINPTGVMASNASNTCEIRADGIYKNGVKVL